MHIVDTLTTFFMALFLPLTLAAAVTMMFSQARSRQLFSRIIISLALFLLGIALLRSLF